MCSTLLSTPVAALLAYEKDVKSLTVFSIPQFFFLIARQSLVGGELLCEVSQLHSDTPHSVGLL